MRFVAGPEQITWRSVRLEINPADMEGFFLFFLGFSRAAPEIDRILDLCRGKVGVFADLGANVGHVSLAVAAACPDLKIVAFEPDPDAARRFRKNLALNPDLAPRITLHELVVADTDDQVVFFRGGPAGTELGSIFGTDASAEALRTPCVRFDTFCSTSGCHPTIMKIDVEGAELLVLLGMSCLPPEDWPELIILEVHSFIHPEDFRRFPADIHQALNERGYELYELSQDGEIPCRPIEKWPARFHIIARRGARQSRGSLQSFLAGAHQAF